MRFLSAEIITLRAIALKLLDKGLREAMERMQRS